MNTYFVTGTDTGVGKTLTSCAILAAANKKNYRTLGLKPIAAGCEETPSGLRNEDALALQAVSSLQLAYEQINPIALREAIAPHIAAANAGKRLRVDRLAGYCRGALANKVDLCVIEGAGGWRVPLNERESLSGLPKMLNIPVILVVGLRLGCLNHTLLTAESIVRDGLQIAAWVSTVIDPKMQALDANLNTLQAMLPFRHLGHIPWLGDKNTAARAAASLAIEPLIATKTNRNKK